MLYLLSFLKLFVIISLLYELCSIVLCCSLYTPLPTKLSTTLTGLGLGLGLYCDYMRLKV